MMLSARLGTTQRFEAAAVTLSGSLPRRGAINPRA
jgi:hypothetical protein